MGPEVRGPTRLLDLPPIMDEKTADGIEIFSFSTDRIEFKSEDDEDYIIGYVSTHERDIVDDIVTRNCMMDMLTQFKNGKSKLDLEHETLRGDSKLEKKMNITKVPLAVSVDALYDGKGLMVKYRMNKEYKKLDSRGDVVYDYPSVKTMIKSGVLDAFSIAYIAELTEKKENDGVITRLLEKVRWINTALTGNPINKGARMVDVLMKSLDEKAREVGGFESPEPGDLPEKGKKILAETYASCREDGGDKEKCSKIAWGAVHNAGFKSIEGKPFGDYDNFDDCVAKNKDKSDPKAYCATIMKKIEGKEGIMEDKENEPKFDKALGEKVDVISASIKSIGDRMAILEKAETEKKSDTSVNDKLKALDEKIDGVKALAEKPVFSAKAGEAMNAAELIRTKALEGDPLNFV